MAETLTQGTKRKKDTGYYIRAAIGICIMIFFGMIPAPAPITQTGMIVIGQFIGLIFLWTTVDMVWPTVVAIVLFGFIAMDVYPASFALASVYEAAAQSWGNWVVVLVLGLLLLCEVLSESGLIRRIALAFLTSRFAKKGPWAFTFMFLLATFVIGLFIECNGVQVLLFALATEIFQMLGIGTEDKAAKVISIGITICVIISCAATPICHSMPLLFMGIYSAIAQTPINWIGYTAICVPIGIILMLLIFAFFRFVVKPDMSKLENIDYSKIEAMKTPMTSKERFVAVITVLLVIFWILPGFLGVLIPESPVSIALNNMTMLTPLLIALAIFAIIRFDGKPVLDLTKALGNIDWMVIMLLAGIMMIASAMGEPTTGISDWVMTIVAPMVSGLSPMMIVVLMCVIAVLLTNIANNIPVGIILITIGVPLALQLNANPFIVAVAVSFCAVQGYTIPPAFVPVGFCYAYPYGGGKYMLRWGLVQMVITAVVTALLMYPLGLLFG